MQHKFNQVKNEQRREASDNAVIIASKGKILESRGDRELIKELKQEMEIDHEKHLRKQALEVSESQVGS